MVADNYFPKVREIAFISNNHVDKVENDQKRTYSDNWLVIWPVGVPLGKVVQLVRYSRTKYSKTTTVQLDNCPQHRTNLTTPFKFKTTGIMVTSSKNVIKCFLEISSPKHYCCYFKSVCHCQDLLSIFSNKKANAL